jgi:Flp pilus assembly pilin Flp
MLKNFWLDDNGAIVSIELILIITIAVLALIVGWSEVAVAVNTELNDISNAVGAFAQSYTATGFLGQGPGATKFKSQYGQQFWQDIGDDCDLNLTCDLVGGTSPAIVAGG